MCQAGLLRRGNLGSAVFKLAARVPSCQLIVTETPVAGSGTASIHELVHESAKPTPCGRLCAWHWGWGRAEGPQSTAPNAFIVHSSVKLSVPNFRPGWVPGTLSALDFILHSLNKRSSSYDPGEKRHSGRQWAT